MRTASVPLARVQSAGSGTTVIATSRRLAFFRHPVVIGAEQWHRFVDKQQHALFREMVVEHLLRSAQAVIAVSLVALLAGCAAEGKAGGDPGARPLPTGMTCQSVRSELNALDARGVPSKVEAVSAGRKVSDKDRADASRYNQLLNYYLGGRCHV
jgi:hypothetical protein